MNIAAAQEAKKQIILSKKVCVMGIIMTRAQFLFFLKSEGYTSYIGEEPKVKWNRIKYNRMTSEREQREYEAKTNEMKPDYRIKSGVDSSFYSVTKTEYDYFNEL